jgi:uncharacterized membrane protein
MTEVLFHAHSGLRYLVLLAAVIAIVFVAIGMASRGPYGRGSRISGAAFMGLLDLQVVVGLILLALVPFQPILIGHIVMMVLALVTAHGLRVMAKRATTDAARHRHALLAVVLPLLLVVGGIMAIGRSVL